MMLASPTAPRTAWIRVKHRLGIVFLVFLPLVQAPSAAGQPTVRLHPETNRAFDEYARSVRQSLENRLQGSGPLLWIEADQKQIESAVAGEVVTEHIDTGDVDVPDGMIHDWIGVMFIPGGTAKETIGVLQDVDQHAKYYPEVLESRVISRDGDTLRSFLRLRKQKVLTVVLDTEHESRYRRLTDQLWYMNSRSTKIAQVKDAGSPNESVMPVGEDGGFLWRLNAHWRVSEVGDGTWVELRTLSLTRGIPFGLGWMIRPFITGIPKESLASTLNGTRAAVQR